VPAATFEAFKAEVEALRNQVAECRLNILREEDLRERFRTLFRSWVSVVSPAIQPLVQNQREFPKLGADLAALAALTTRNRPVAKYRKRINRVIELANSLVLHLPLAVPAQHYTRQSATEELFIRAIPDLPVRLVPSSILGWKRQMEVFLSQQPFDKSVFIMIRYRNRNAGLIAAIKRALSKRGFVGILASDHRITDDLYNPIACLLCCARGIAVFDRPESRQVFNPNVAYELGMLHLLGRECIILKHKSLDILHTDILMKLYLEYGGSFEAQSVVENWLKNNP